MNLELRCYQLILHLLLVLPSLSRLVEALETRTVYDQSSLAPNYWPKYSGKRHVFLLDGVWNSTQLGSIHDPPKDFDSMNPYLDVQHISMFDRTPVPSTVDNTLPGFLGYRGVTFFQTQVKHDSSTPARILFQACSFYCRVWLNGQEIGSHRGGGYVAWWLDVPIDVLQTGCASSQTTLSLRDTKASHPCDTHKLTVLVDNRFNKTTAPLHTGGDFWHYGGILRSVEWHVLSRNHSNQGQEHWPWRCYVTPLDLSTIQLSVHLVDRDAQGSIQNVKVYFDGNQNETSILEGKAKDGIADLGTLTVPKPRVWSTAYPHLHTVSIDMNGAVVTERFGLRIWDTDPVTNQVRLNGNPIKLVGWNHHTQWPYTGASPTDEQLDDDLQLILAGNANYVRGAHYPQDPRWLDRLDEAGLVMWSETLGPDVEVSDLTDPYFLHWQERQINEMLDNAFNHASIAFWGFFNEGPSQHPEACPGYLASSKAIRARDSTRFVTYASNRYLHDKCYEAATAISHNGYPGWYHDTNPTQYWQKLASEIHAGNLDHSQGKPFLISETGAAGIYEWTTNTSASKWTLEYQNQVLLEDVDVAIHNINISGITLWHFFDFKVDDQWENNTHCDYLPDASPPTCGYIEVNTSSAAGRPGGANHKGVLDFFRRPKPSFSLVASRYKNVTTLAD
eukprot:Nitzschia sp. Nitz4//scaffold180_size44305//9875//11896//NITZ4_007235-RA/size44305-processed-gene-0.18-mRNA-1//-1//CDS//3329539455//1701//frame0